MALFETHIVRELFKKRMSLSPGIIARVRTLGRLVLVIVSSIMEDGAIITAGRSPGMHGTANGARNAYCVQHVSKYVYIHVDRCDFLSRIVKCFGMRLYGK